MLSVEGYQDLDLIHSGFNSQVYRADRASDQQPVVLKILRKSYPTPEEVARFRLEYDLTKCLTTPGIIQAYGLEPYNNTLMLVLEDYGGQSLKVLMESVPLTVPAVLEIALQVAQALAVIHQHGIIHKDINPANILLNQATGKVKIIDFGIATQLSQENTRPGNLDSLEGTPAYLSPEQTGRMNRSLDYRSDFYSLGATLYELLTGQPPFVSEDLAELVHSHIARQPIAPAQIEPTIPDMVSQIVMRLLAKNAEARYQSAHGLAHDLQRCLQAWQAAGHIEPFELGQADRSDRFQIPQKLYGREAEVAALLAAFDRVSQADTPAELVLVSGYSGIGKSALVQEIHKPITAKRGYYISGKYDQFQRNLPYSALIQAFTTLVRQLLTASRDEIDRWRDRLNAALAPNAAVLIEVIPELELILGPQPEAPTLSADAAQNRLNLVFEQFIRVFSQPQHPLVLFLDDLQWADSASLQLIQVLMRADAQQSLLLVGAYRDNEVDATHPLRATLADLQQAQVTIHDFHLTALQFGQIQALLQDTFVGVSAEDCQALATLLQAKTNGNPFFMGEFLKSLYSDGLVYFEPSKGWQWSLDQIEAAQITDNVVELMADKLQKLPEATQQALQVGAGIGNVFTLHLVAAVRQAAPQQTAAALWEAAQQGLIIPEDDNYKLWQAIAAHDDDPFTMTAGVSYRFLHDRVQQAAYSLIDPAQINALHLQIGRTWQQQLTAEQQQERLFDLVNQLNFGVELLTADDERQALAELNLAAGQKAIAAAAYVPAYAYLSAGLRCLSAQSWQLQYDLTLQLHQAATEAAFLSGDFEAMDRLVTTVVSQAHDVLDCVAVYTVQIQALMARHELAAAAQLGLRVLQQLGVKLPAAPNQMQILLGLARTKLALWGKPTPNLAQQPDMSDPYAIAATRILASIASATYLAVPNLFPLTVFKQVELSARYGNLPLSAFSYAMYGLILCGVVGDLKGGYGFGELAMALLNRFQAQALPPRTLFVVNSFVRHWRDPLPETLPELQRGFQAGYETGDTEYAGFCAQLSTMHGLFAGEPLPELAERAQTFAEAILKFKKLPIYELIQQSRQTIANLQGTSEQPTALVGEFYDVQEKLPQHLDANYRTAIFYAYSYQLMLHYSFGDYEGAIAAADAGQQYLEAVVALYITGWFTFYSALTQLALVATAAPQHRRQLIRAAKKNRRKLATWAASAPTNYAHKLALVDAELQRVQGRYQQAEIAYDRAIHLALDHQFISEAALANERAALYYLDQQRPKIATPYLQEAHYLYGQWGATAKVNALVDEFPQLTSLNTDPTSRSVYSTLGNTVSVHTTGGKSNDNLDWMTAMRASQALSEEIQLDKLLKTLMRLLIENAGAQRGLLLLETDGDFRIEAQGSVDQAEDEQADVEVTESIAIADIADADVLSVGIVNYVARTQNSVVLNDATQIGDFVQDAYVQAHQPQSILCAPLLNQGKLAGIVYLENNLTTGAFTPKRLELLNLISTQAAISIENARLYTDLATLNKAYERFVPGQFLQLLGKDSITKVELGDSVRQEMSILFSDIRDFTALSEKLSPEDNFALINSFLSRMDRVIAEHNGFIDKYIGDAIMALFSGSADEAVQGGIAMLEQLRAYNEHRSHNGYQPLRIGIGINTGSLMLGTVGGQNRMDSTVISDAVNLASRIEGLTKVYDVPLLIGEGTFFNLTDHDRYHLRIVDKAKVKGKSIAVTVYEVFDADEPVIKAGKIQTRSQFEQGLLLYYNQKFGEAYQRFQECLTYNPGDSVARIYVERCQSQL
ncbi:AAA family ATPase [Leptolyngbya iicbica]|uniref:GAF domain-containing protein n=2 Tax=Cyanophyceae TaxID=3028117 RepID=A0A4Q7E3J2_9CYAN|nr:AAA family ATPase [Leptolyngbya sp. LK]RZM75677.1 GAF domain-containing protein [Leptolyngbya sp. LK]